MNRNHPCDHDCAHCRHADCICNDGPTRWESEVLSGALGRWEHESIDKQVSYLASLGWGDKEILSAMNITDYEISLSYERIRNKKRRAARVCKHKAVQVKLA